MTKKNALIIFVKMPVPGQVKTRLQPQISPEESAELYTALLKDIDNKFNNPDDIDSWYAVSPENFQKDVLDQVIHLDNFFLQSGLDLGERMNHAFESMFLKGYEKVVLIGSDLPSITTDIVSQAYQDLDSGDCVIGPSKDGGYYLIALSDLHSDIFKNLPWSTSKVFEKTIDILDKKGLTYLLLPEHEDIDTHKELNSFYLNYKKKNNSDPDFPIHSWSITSKLIEKR